MQYFFDLIWAQSRSQYSPLWVDRRVSNDRGSGSRSRAGELGHLCGSRPGRL